MALLLAVALAACACDRGAARGDAPAAAASVAPRPGGDTTVASAGADAFSLPAANLTGDRSDPHFVGNSLFNRNWVAAPASAAGRDGLGPLFNARSCSGCHFKDGRGRPPLAEGEDPVSLIFKLGVREAEGQDAIGADPVYGDQLQTFALDGLPAEGRVAVRHEEVPGRYADGEPFSLRRPIYELRDAAYGAPAKDLVLAPRVAPQVIGLGLLEAIPESDLLALADPDDRDGDGISGRAQRVPVAGGGTALGRFGWKAGQPSVEAQTLAALSGDMGITSHAHPDQNHTSAQACCDELPSGGEPEIDDATLAFLDFYMCTLGVPARRDPLRVDVREGEQLFSSAGCAACHVPAFTAAADATIPEIAGQTFHPYTDLLLHDMGPGLSDDRREHAASGREWRTPPLWGVGLLRAVNGHDFLLHDGRARGVAEAILWHDGEGRAARDAFVRMSASQRAALIAFVEDL